MSACLCGRACVLWMSKIRKNNQTSDPFLFDREHNVCMYVRECICICFPSRAFVWNFIWNFKRIRKEVSFTIDVLSVNLLSVSSRTRTHAHKHAHKHTHKYIIHPNKLKKIKKTNKQNVFFVVFSVEAIYK